MSPSGTHALQFSPAVQLFGLGSEQTPTGEPAWMTHLMSPAPGILPAWVGSPPQQSLSTWQRSPVTWQPEAGWQMWEPEVPNGAHRDEQQPVQPEQSVPSTSQVVPGTAAQTPAVAPAAFWQMAVQQSLSA